MTFNRRKAHFDPYAVVQPDLFRNGSFDVNQRDLTGSSTIPNKTWVKDSWQYVEGNGSLIPDCEYSTFYNFAGNGLRFRWPVTFDPGLGAGIRQRWEVTNGEIDEIVGRDLTVTVRINNDVDADMALFMRWYNITQSGMDGSGVREVVSTLASDTEVSITRAVPAFDAGGDSSDKYILEIGIEFRDCQANQNYRFYRAKAEWGPIFTGWPVSDYQVELARCQRYCWVTVGTTRLYTYRSDANLTRQNDLYYPVEMWKTPTVSNITAVSGTAPTAANVDRQRVRLQSTADNANAGAAIGTGLTFEAELF